MSGVFNDGSNAIYLIVSIYLRNAMKCFLEYLRKGYYIVNAHQALLFYFDIYL